MSFFLDKYYFDAVAPDGRCFIGYAARLKWGLLRLNYHGGIWSDGNGDVRTIDRYFSTVRPNEEQEAITWSTPKGAGAWRGPIAHQPKTLIEGSQGSIDWELYQDRARVNLSDGPFGALSGIGYTERLRMSVLPWRTPIKILYWGRFHGERTTIVWIRWVGPVPRLILRLNGVQHEEGHVDEQEVRVDGHVLCFGKSHVLRDGTLRQNLFGDKRWPGVIFPSSVLNIEEKKFVSRCTSTDAAGVTDHGWAIHEIVTWP